MMLFYLDKDPGSVLGLRSQRKRRDERKGLDTSVSLGFPLGWGVAEVLAEGEDSHLQERAVLSTEPRKGLPWWFPDMTVH